MCASTSLLSQIRGISRQSGSLLHLFTAHQSAERRGHNVSSWAHTGHDAHTPAKPAKPAWYPLYTDRDMIRRAGIRAQSLPEIQRSHMWRRYMFSDVFISNFRFLCYFWIWSTPHISVQSTMKADNPKSVRISDWAIRKVLWKPNFARQQIF